jgi:hypothetical protein
MGRRRLAFVAVCLVGVCLGLPARGAGAQTLPAVLVQYPELVVLNAKVVTADDRFSLQQAVAVRDGKVLAVGSTDQIRTLAGPGTRVVDAGGRTVLPGLIDSHIHFLRAGFRWKWEVRADEAQSLNDILEAIAARAQQVPPGTWILVLGGWHYSQVKERRMPTRAELDRIAPNHPVHVQALYDVAQMNTAAIRASGITGSTAAPQGAVLEKDAQGNFTGVIRGFAGMRFAETKFPQPTMEEKIEGLRLAMRDFNAAGLTGVVEGVGGGVADEDYQALFEAWRRRQMTLRVGLHFHANDHDHAQQWLRHLPAGFGDDMLRLNGMGEILMWPLWDGATPASFTVSQQTKAEFQKIVEAAAVRRVTLQLHATIESSMNNILDVLEEANRRRSITDLRFALIHAELITPRINERMRKLGMGVLMQDRRVMNSDRMKQVWGARAEQIALRSTFQSGLPMGGGTDATVAAPFRPFISLWWFIAGKNWRGEVVRPTERLTREEALRVYTRGSAWFTFEEDRKGALVPGFLGDLVILDKDYLTVPEDEIRFLRPMMTVVGGKVVYEAKP